MSEDLTELTNPKQVGTRASGTDSLIYRVLQSPRYRTEDILSRFLAAAITSPQPDVIRKRARKMLAMILRRGDSAIPRTTLDLVSWSELTADEEARPLNAISLPGAKVRKARRRPRHFRHCKQCGTRFLAKRTDQHFHSPKCRVRFNRANPGVTGSCTDPSGTHINTGDNERVSALRPVLGLSSHNARQREAA